MVLLSFISQICFDKRIMIFSGGGEPSGPVRVLNPGDTFQILFFALFGLIEPDNLPPINRNPLVSIFFVQIVFGIYHIITLIVLINLLIAMMSDTYQRIQVGGNLVVYVALVALWIRFWFKSYQTGAQPCRTYIRDEEGA